MCGRFTLNSNPASVAELFLPINGSQNRFDFDASYNIAPTQDVLVARIKKNKEPDSDSPAQLDRLRWGLVPFWAKDLKIGARMINARSETVAEKPAFRSAFKKRRCLVVADGFFEWKKTTNGKQPFFITIDGGRPFCFAGLWESWRPQASHSDTDKTKDASANPIETCTVITTDANRFMQPIHDRMPVILDQDKFEVWLDPDFQSASSLKAMMKQIDSERMTAVPVSTFVNKPTNNSPQCVEPIEA